MKWRLEVNWIFFFYKSDDEFVQIIWLFGKSFEE